MDFTKIVILENLRNTPKHKQNPGFFVARGISENQNSANIRKPRAHFFSIQPKRGGTLCVTRPAAAPASQGGFGWGTAPGNRSRYKQIGPIIAFPPPHSYLQQLLFLRPRPIRTNPHTASNIASSLPSGDKSVDGYLGGCVGGSAIHIQWCTHATAEIGYAFRASATEKGCSGN